MRRLLLMTGLVMTLGYVSSAQDTYQSIYTGKEIDSLLTIIKNEVIGGHLTAADSVKIRNFSTYLYAQMSFQNDMLYNILELHGIKTFYDGIMSGKVGEKSGYIGLGSATSSYGMVIVPVPPSALKFIWIPSANNGQLSDTLISAWAMRQYVGSAGHGWFKDSLAASGMIDSLRLRDWVINGTKTFMQGLAVGWPSVYRGVIKFNHSGDANYDWILGPETGANHYWRLPLTPNALDTIETTYGVIQKMNALPIDSSTANRTLKKSSAGNIIDGMKDVGHAAGDTSASLAEVRALIAALGGGTHEWFDDSVTTSAAIDSIKNQAFTFNGTKTFLDAIVVGTVSPSGVAGQITLAAGNQYPVVFKAIPGRTAQQTIWFPNTGNSVDTAAVLESVRDAIAALPIDSSTTGRILMKSSTGSGAIVNGPEFPLDNTTTNHLAKKHSDGSIVDGPRYNGTSSDTVLTADEVREQIEVYGYGTGSGTGDLDTPVSDQFSTTATRDTVVIANINSTCTIFGLTARMTAATDTALAADSRLMAWAESGRAIISRGSGGTSGLKYSFAWRWAAPGIVFKPDSLGGLLGWWAGRFYTGSDNDSVATWKNHTADSVTTAWNLTLTPRDNYVPRYAMKPIFKTNVINSLPVVRFTRNDTTSLTCDSLGGRFAGIDRPFTVVMVGKVHTLIVGQPIWSFSKAAVDSFQTHYGYVDSSASDERRMGQYRRNSLDQQQFSSNSVIPSQANNLTSPWVAVWSFDGDSVWTQFNGGERFILEPVVFKTWAGMGSFTLGQQYDAGENLPAHCSNVDVAELLVYNKELSSAELTYLYAQLKSIYNTP